MVSSQKIISRFWISKGLAIIPLAPLPLYVMKKSVAVVDGNVYRVLARYFGIDTPINSTEGIKQFKALAQSLLPPSNFGDYNQAIMEFGRSSASHNRPIVTYVRSFRLVRLYAYWIY